MWEKEIVSKTFSSIIIIIFLVVVVVVVVVDGRAKRAPHWGVQSRFRVIYIYVGMYVCRMSN